MISDSSQDRYATKDKSIVSYFTSGTTLSFSSGETIINGFDEPEGAYFIKEGFVKAWSTSYDGHANLLLIHEAGEIVPLPWALNGYHLTGLFYEAMSDVVVVRSPKADLRRAMGSDTWLTDEILNQTVNIIATYTQRIQILEYRSARGRIIAELLLVAGRFGKTYKGGIRIDAPITHQDIADSINMTRETASRGLEKLFEEGLLAQEDRTFCIPDINKLKLALQ